MNTNQGGQLDQNGGAQQAGQQPQRTLALQPSQIQQLASNYRHEMAQARVAGNNTPEGHKHLANAERIKQVLVNYQQQQQQLRQRQRLGGQQAPPSAQPQQIPQGVSNGNGSQMQQNLATNPAVRQQVPQPQPQQQQQQQQQQPSAVATPQFAMNNNIPAATPGVQNGDAQARAQKPISIEQFNALKAKLLDFEKKLKIIEQNKKNTNLAPEVLNSLSEQEAVLKQRYDQYRKAAIVMRQKIQQQHAQQTGITQQQQQQQQQQQNGTPLSNQQINQNLMVSRQGSPINQQSPIVQQQNLPQQNVQQQVVPRLSQDPLQLPTPASANMIGRVPSGQLPLSNQQAIPTPQMKPGMPTQQLKTNAGQLTNNQIKPPNSLPQQPLPQQQNGLPVGVQGQVKPGSIPNNNNGVRSSTSPPVTAANAAARPQGAIGGSQTANPVQTSLAGITKPTVPSIPIPQTLNIKPTAPVFAKATRPTLNGGNAISSASLSTPALVKLPPFELQGDRVLSKRKLSELVSNIGADEGDGKTVIDGDVEELLLDIADEFVTSVTSFACRLAKHRKVDTLDAKDIQLHLEKNWNMRIPGYSSDEIRNIRKWQPNQSYNQKKAGVGISRSVNGNMG